MVENVGEIVVVGEMFGRLPCECLEMEEFVGGLVEVGEM